MFNDNNKNSCHAIGWACSLTLLHCYVLKTYTYLYEPKYNFLNLKPYSL